MTSPNPTVYERLDKAAEDGDIKKLYQLISEDPNVLRHSDQVSFCETPLHIAARNGQTHFAMELMTLKPSLALKLNTSGLSPMHIALGMESDDIMSVSNPMHTRMVRGFIAIDSSLARIKGKGRITPLHYVTQIGNAELMSELLFACPYSVEDLTIKCETVMHIAVKRHHFEAFKVLLGWIKRLNKEEILDWKDEDGNTVLHIAASVQQTEIMKLLRPIVKLNAKNLDGKTAMDILQANQSHHRPNASRLFRTAEILLFGPTRALSEYLTLSLFEKLTKIFGLNHFIQSRHRSLSSNDSRSAILVVAILIVTATYQAGLSPPGGYWQENSSESTQDYYDNAGHTAGQMTMSFNNAIFFYVLNGVAFFSSLYVIMILIIGLPMWMVLYGSTAALGIANYASFSVTLPSPNSPFEEVALSLLPFAYPVITGLILFPPVVVFFVNKGSRRGTSRHLSCYLNEA
ncbi:hypothetical protein Bca4012_036543 [Brassica carinata]